jgi:hypothetical protein
MSWHHIGLIVNAAKDTGSSSAPHTKKKEEKSKTSATVEAARSRLLRISIMSCICLLMNVAFTLKVSLDFREWSHTAETSLYCRLEDSGWNRDWEIYGLKEGDRCVS